MNIQEYKEYSLKKRTLHVQLPSGFEFNVLLPTPYELIFKYHADQINENDAESSKKIFEIIKLPDGLDYSDFTAEDLAAFMQQVRDFFTTSTESLSGFKNMQKE